MSDRLVLLGTGTCQLQEERIGSSVLLELDGLRVVFDFGRGVAERLQSLGLGQDDIRHVVLSHFHADHLSDLIPFLHAGSWSQIDPRTADLDLYGPVGLEALFHGLLGLFESLVRGERFELRLHEIHDDSLVIDGVEFVSRELPPAGNRGLKLTRGDITCAMTGDSFFHQQEIEFLRGVDLAIVDAGHLTDEELVELAVETRVRRLVCSHLYREIDAERLTVLATKRGFDGEVIIGEDLMSFAL
jgi:ribonuclease BN (tRNA processing enzyme)